jgi:hypothetical protein
VGLETRVIDWPADGEVIEALELVNRDPQRFMDRIVEETADAGAACGHGDSLRGLLKIADAAVDLGERVHQLLAPRFVRDGGQLPLQVGPGQAQRLKRQNALGVEARASLPGRAAAVLDFLHPLFEPRAGVDESLTCVAHSVRIPFRAGFVAVARR